MTWGKDDGALCSLCHAKLPADVTGPRLEEDVWVGFVQAQEGWGCTVQAPQGQKA